LAEIKKTEDSKKKSKKIKILKNGPYLVSGGVPLIQQEIGINDAGESCEWRTVKEYPLKENYSLCRCGQSGNKPFCDGTHVKISFNGAETASREPYLSKAETTEGPSLRLTDNQSLCASARFCHRAGGIWKLVPQSDNPGSKKIAMEEAADCPSGTLVVWDKANGKAIEPQFPESIVMVEDPQKEVSGPIWARGGITVESADGSNYEARNRVTLCRCGKSTNKPYCDSSHYPE
jgi:CDGSH-type Zn-finger protein